jgi:hypothetical protein
MLKIVQGDENGGMSRWRFVNPLISLVFGSFYCLVPNISGFIWFGLCTNPKKVCLEVNYFLLVYCYNWRFNGVL